MRFLLLLLLFLLVSQAAAHEGAENPVEQISVKGLGVVTYQRLFEAVSEPGETLDAFVLRVSPRLRAFSDETGFEACGVLASDGERFGVVVGTSHAHIACVNLSVYRPEGMTSVNKTLHSHGSEGKFKPNRADLALQGQHMSGRYKRLNTVHGQKLDEFSDDDVRSGAGYLAGTQGRVYFQDGGAAREVK